MTFKLRDYQKKAHDMTIDWISANSGNLCVEMPTGSGKSIVISYLCKHVITSCYDGEPVRILMATHVKELIEQNYEKLMTLWPTAPAGIYSASIGRKQIEQITFAGIQSIRNKSEQLGHIDLMLIDECHLINNKNEGMYRKLINDLSEINPNLRVIGYTATPYRMGSGPIYGKGCLFDGIIQPTSITELIFDGHLANLRSKHTDLEIDVSDVKKAGGEYVEKYLQEAVDTEDYNLRVVKETINRAEDRKTWLFSCTGVDHAFKIRDLLRESGITAETITGKTPKHERAEIIRKHKSGEITALTNANVLTTGFDNPNIDLLALVRPTMSTALYVQIVGRGLRKKEHTDHCLVLDFVGLVEKHGPVDEIDVIAHAPTDREKGEPVTKVCDNCGEICSAAAKTCKCCGKEFPFLEDSENKPVQLRNDAILNANEDKEKIAEIDEWWWERYIAKSSNRELLKIYFYHGTIDEKPITMFLTVGYPGKAGERALKRLEYIASKGEINLSETDGTISGLADYMNKNCPPPRAIKYLVDGSFYEVKSMAW